MANTMNKTIDTLTLKKGDLLYNQGKFGDAPGWGEIIEVIEPTKKNPLQYTVDMGADYYDTQRRYITIPHYCLKSGVGQLFITAEQFQLCRQQANDRLNEYYKKFNRTTPAQ
jgi:hypothetical protein